MRDFLSTFVGKSVRAGLSFRRGGGQALPGLVIEKLDSRYVARMLDKLPEGVVVVTGTNGKTTTTKMIVELLKANGKTVLTNSTGSNLVRGIASSIAQHASISGRLRYDIAVLEVDEAAAKTLSELIRPSWVLALNVSRDQLDRFGEVDTIAGYIENVMRQARDGIIVNAGDPHLIAATRRAKVPAHYFGVAPTLKKYFPSDYELAAVDKEATQNSSETRPLDVRLANFRGQKVTYKIDGQNYTANLKLSGQHNYLNGAAALALVRRLIPGNNPSKLVEELASVSLAFGRGEKYRLKNGAEIELVLVKNPASFTQALSSYNAKESNLMIAINDNIADGRDVSWLWDVNFVPLQKQKVFLTSGRRAADMALRLSYDEIKTLNVEPDLHRGLMTLGEQPGPKVVLATYTAMLQLYAYLSKRGEKI
ncbi:MAG TPA: MurT ligase domain-containing protein [Candidatus Saccharimonadales bacterium]|nr:MurT ligase domain-containing protein [Candidatus Saccharimonadales bacterium]